MKKQVDIHSLRVLQGKASKEHRRNLDRETQEFHNRIVASKYWPSSRKPPMGWHYQGTLARGKAYRQLRKVDPHFMTYVGRAAK